MNKYKFSLLKLIENNNTCKDFLNLCYIFSRCLAKFVSTRNTVFKTYIHKKTLMTERRLSHQGLMLKILQFFTDH